MSGTDVSIDAVSRALPTGAATRSSASSQETRPTNSQPVARKEPAGASQPENIRESVGQLNEAVQNIRRELHFTVDDYTGKTIIRVIDSSTQEVVRQIPAEEVLALLTHMREHDPRLMVDTQA